VSPTTKRFVAVLAVLLGVFATEARAQAGQVAADFSARQRGESATALRARKNEAVKLLAALQQAAREKPSETWTGSLKLVIALGVEATETADGDPLLSERLRVFADQFTKFALELPPASGGSVGMLGVPASASLGVKTASGSTPPFAFTLSPKTVFALGTSFSSVGLKGQTYEVSTNLIGTAVAAVSGSLGAGDDLKNFVAKNLAVGIAFPSKSAGSVQTSFSLGLGSAELGGATLWPVLAMQQLDSTSTQIPAEIRASDTTQTTWSAPYIGIGFTMLSRETTTERLKAGKLVPIFSLGVQLPYYFAGSSAAAFGGVFSTGEKKFVGAGKARIVASFSIPLLRNDATTPDTPAPGKK